MQHASGSIKVTIVGHKCDADTDREVTTSEGEKMARHYDCMFFETSAVTGHNVANVSNLHCNSTLEVLHLRHNAAP